MCRTGAVVTHFLIKRSSAENTTISTAFRCRSTKFRKKSPWLGCSKFEITIHYILFLICACVWISCTNSLHWELALFLAYICFASPELMGKFALLAAAQYQEFPASRQYVPPKPGIAPKRRLPRHRLRRGRGYTDYLLRLPSCSMPACSRLP